MRLFFEKTLVFFMFIEQPLEAEFSLLSVIFLRKMRGFPYKTQRVSVSGRTCTAIPFKHNEFFFHKHHHASFTPRNKMIRVCVAHMQGETDTTSVGNQTKKKFMSPNRGGSAPANYMAQLPSSKKKFKRKTKMEPYGLYYLIMCNLLTWHHCM